MMKKRIKGFVVFLCVFLLVIPAGAVNASLNGRWISLQHGALTFNQVGNAFTAVWSGANARGTISGREASFRFWSGASFEKCSDDSRGYGTLTLSDEGNTLSGSWANLSKKEPESGSFTALRVSSINGLITQDAAPEPEEAPDAETTGTDPALADTASIPDTSSAQTGTGQETSASGTPTGTKPPGDGSSFETDTLPHPADELILMENLPPEYIGPVAEFLSDIEESVLMIFGVFDGDSGLETDADSHPADELILAEDLPPGYTGPFAEFLSDIEESVLKIFDVFD